MTKFVPAFGHLYKAIEQLGRERDEAYRTLVECADFIQERGNGGGELYERIRLLLADGRDR